MVKMFIPLYKLFRKNKEKNTFSCKRLTQFQQKTPYFLEINTKHWTVFVKFHDMDFSCKLTES